MNCVLSQFFAFYKAKENSHKVYFWKFLAYRDPRYANVLIKLQVPLKQHLEWLMESSKYIHKSVRSLRISLVRTN